MSDLLDLLAEHRDEARLLAGTPALLKISIG